MIDQRYILRLHCPSCGAKLLETNDGFTCPECGNHSELVQGIPCLVKNRDYYYGEITSLEMQELVAACNSKHWSTALESLLRKKVDPSFLLNYTLSPRRAAWWPLLGFYPKGRILDIGCGWGTISFNLAQHVGEVVACDLCFERLLFLSARASQDGFSNIRFVWAGDTERLPFGDGEFDVVIMNGVLEWVPTNSKGDPTEIQQRFLKEAARILQPDGQLLLGIENRFAWGYIRGKPEDHSNIPYVSLLPRRLASLYAVIAYGKTYRTYTYSFWGYKNLLRKAGFCSSKLLVPRPGYRLFDTILDPLQPRLAARYYADHGIGPSNAIKSKVKAHLTRLLASDYCWIANRGKAQESFLEALVSDFARRRYGLERTQMQWLNFHVSEANTIVASIQVHQNLPQAVLKLPLDKFAEHLCEREYVNLEELHQRLPHDDSWQEIPRAVARGEWCGRAYFVQTLCQGVNGSRIVKIGGDKYNWKDAALEWLLKLHKATCQLMTVDESVWDCTIRRRIEPALLFYDKEGISRKRLDDYLARHVLGRNWPLVFSHGDYWYGNLIFDSTAKHVTGVVDWDRANPQSVPCLDLIHLLLYETYKFQPANVRLEILADCARDGLRKEIIPSMTRYIKEMGMTISANEMKAFFVLYWLQQVTERIAPCDAKRTPESIFWQDNIRRDSVWLDLNSIIP